MLLEAENINYYCFYAYMYVGDFQNESIEIDSSAGESQKHFTWRIIIIFLFFCGFTATPLRVFVAITISRHFQPIVFVTSLQLFSSPHGLSGCFSTAFFSAALWCIFPIGFRVIAPLIVYYFVISARRTPGTVESVGLWRSCSPVAPRFSFVVLIGHSSPSHSRFTNQFWSVHHLPICNYKRYTKVFVLLNA